MSNKKKRSNKSQKAAAATTDASASAGTPAAPLNKVQSALLSQGQLAAFILLAMGLSRWMELQSAVHHLSTKSPPDDDAAVATDRHAYSALCRSYLSYAPDVCADAGLHALLRMKLVTGLQLLVTATMMVLVHWRREERLKPFNCLLVLTPLTASMMVFVSHSGRVIAQGRVWQQMRIALVLSFLGFSPQAMPFLVSNGGRRPRKTLPSLLLMTLVCVHLFEAAAGMGWVSLGPSSSDDSGLSSAWIPKAWAGSDDANLLQAMTTVHWFLLVDMVSMAAIYLFGWYYLDESSQKTFLFFVGAFRFAVSYFYQWPPLEGEVEHVDLYKTQDLTTAVAALLCYVAPSNLRWKSKLS